jgi:TatD DNase family protein
MMGLHPCSVKEDFEKELKIIKKHLDEHRDQVIAIGEIGIDLYWDVSTKNNQEIAFKEQLHWASAYKLPIAIHSRNSTEVIISILEELNDLKLTGVFHCFSGSRTEAEKIIDLGFLLGIGGVLTFKNSGLDKVISDIPMEYIVLETDAPYLAPAPYRGKTNLPVYLKLVAEKLAQVKNTSLDQIATITSDNARRLFGLN